MERTHDWGRGWLGKELAFEQALKFRSQPPLKERFSLSETCLNRGVQAGKHKLADGIVSSPVRLGKSEVEELSIRCRCPVGPPKTGGSWWRGLTECGPLEKGMANHFSILALRTP